MTPTCPTCRFAAPAAVPGHALWFCRHSPPRDHEWPIVGPDDYCAQHQPVVSAVEYDINGIEIKEK